ncbi:chitin-binding type-2 domain-containing protein, partial [Nephila pilipes]
FQSNQPQFHNENNQNQFQSNQLPFHNENNQQQFQGNPSQFRNLNDQYHFNNVNNQQQFDNRPLLQNNQAQIHNVNNQQHFQTVKNQPQLNNIDIQTQFHNANFEQNVGVKGTQDQSQGQTDDVQNSQQNHGGKGFQGHQNFREARNDFNFPRPNLQTINANDAIIYNQNAPRAAESSISYNGWKPIVKF